MKKKYDILVIKKYHEAKKKLDEAFPTNSSYSSRNQMTKTCWMGIAIVSLYVVLTGVLGTALFFLRTSSGFPFTLDGSVDKITLKFYLKCKANNQNIVIESLLYPWTIFQSG